MVATIYTEDRFARSVCQAGEPPDAGDIQKDAFVQKVAFFPCCLRPRVTRNRIARRVLHEGWAAVRPSVFCRLCV